MLPRDASSMYVAADVTWKTSAADALLLLDEQDFDVVVTDLHMEGMNGFAFCERVVANRPDVPVVMITAFGSLDSAVGAIRAGAYDFITKPFDVESLRLTLSRAVQHRRLRDEVKRLRQVVSDTSGSDPGACNQEDRGHRNRPCRIGSHRTRARRLDRCGHANGTRQYVHGVLAADCSGRGLVAVGGRGRPGGPRDLDSCPRRPLVDHAGANGRIREVQRRDELVPGARATHRHRCAGDGDGSSGHRALGFE